MRAVIFVPGFLGSTLETPHFLFGYTDYWISYIQLALNGVEPLKLAPNGFDPDPKVGWPMRAAEAYGPVYDQPMNTLQNLLRGRYSVTAWGYDFRLHPILTGIDLAAYIRRVAAPTEPATLICHSLGGLVARSAWRQLVESGDAHLVRRIITLGTPHRGTYAPCQVFNGENRAPLWLTLLWSAGQIGSTYKRLYVIPTFSQLQKTMETICTWPALYCLMPFLDPIQARDDPLASGLFDRANWSGNVFVSEHWLTNARDTWQPYISSNLALPPDQVLTCIGGSNNSTPIQTLDLSNLMKTDGYRWAPGGDSVVGLSSALVGRGPKESLPGDHNHLPSNPQVSAQLVAWIDDERQPLGPGAPADPTVTLGGPGDPNNQPEFTPQQLCERGECQC